MKKCLNSTGVLRSIFWTLTLGTLAAGVGAYTLTRQPQNRKSTDPPSRAHGKLGQDLFIAITHHDLAGVQTLLKRGADPDSRNGLGFTPLYMAAASHQQEVMEALLAAHANPDADSTYGTPLVFAASSVNVAGAGLLLSKGVKVDPIRDDGMSALMMAANTGAPPVVGLLLQHKAKVNAKDDDGATALSYASRVGGDQVGQMLLDAGAEVDVADYDGRTPLMYAAMNGHAEFVRKLLRTGANPNWKDGSGRTALLLAASYGDYPDVVNALKEGGADVNIKDRAGRTALDLAVFHGYSGAAAVLRNGTAGRSSVPAKSAPVAVASSLKLLQSSMLKFNHMTKCVSCHQEGLGRIALGVARERGFSLDPEVLKAQQERIDGMITAMRPLHEQALVNTEVMKQVPLVEIDEVDTLYSWLMAGMASQNEPSNPGTDAMALVMAKQQEPDGHWGFSGPREPMQSSYFTFTALTVRALKTYGPKSHSKEVADRISKARTWLEHAPVKNSEDRASLLLGLKWSGADQKLRSRATALILADQHADGGWAQLPGMTSDAYATGQALYALHEAGGVSVSSPVYKKGVKFLLRTQDTDGSWFVNKRAMPGNNYFDGGFPHGQSQYASFNGTCWATMALMQTVPEPRRHVVAMR